MPKNSHHEDKVDNDSVNSEQTIKKKREKSIPFVSILGNYKHFRAVALEETSGARQKVTLFQ